MLKKPILILVFIGLLSSLEAQAYSTFSNGMLIKGSGPEVYVLEYGVKRWISTPAIFKKLFYNWGNIKLVTDEALNGFSDGKKISSDFSNGALIKSEKSPKVYLYDNGKLRWVSDIEIFDSNDFSWENVITIPDKNIKAKKKGADVENGEFILLPTAFITAKPLEETDIKKVTFSYSGSSSAGSVSDLVWETFLKGYDTSWKASSVKYTRTIDLPAVNKTYTFYVRSQDKKSKVSSWPASYTFKVVGFSPINEQIKINSIKRKGIDEVDEYIRLTNVSKANIDITGFVLKNQNNETVNILQAIEKPYLQAGDLLENLILEPGKSATVFSGLSPVGKNFRLNKCIGYLNTYYSFLPKLKEECPMPAEQELLGLEKNCRDYIKSLKACKPPDTSNIKVSLDKQCTDYLITNLNYSGCVSRYQSDPDFLKNDWYVYLNKRIGFWSDSHDEVRLFDKENSLVAKRSY